MAETEWVSPQEARRKADDGEALLVCAYDSDEKYRQMPLEGSISLAEFQDRLPEIPQGRELIFYCA
jgi:hypothetical protein